jgi:hypothetical protein
MQAQMIGALKRSLQRSQRAATQLREGQGTQTPPLAPRATSPGSNRSGEKTELSYSYMNGKWR